MAAALPPTKRWHLLLGVIGEGSAARVPFLRESTARKTAAVAARRTGDRMIVFKDGDGWAYRPKDDEEA